MGDEQEAGLVNPQPLHLNYVPILAFINSPEKMSPINIKTRLCNVAFIKFNIKNPDRLGL